VEIDRASGALVNVWDLRASLDAQRRAWPTDLADLDVDWFHANAVAYDAADDAIIVSGRTQGVVKLTATNDVVWILAPHRAWGTAGDGTDLVTRLLQPLDAAAQPITDPAVLDGAANHPDFEWAWYQHAPTLMPDGALLVFDNGDTRNYIPNGSGQTYSRAVVYRIDEAARTVQQTWQYGKERGAATHSRIVSDVDVHAAEGTVVFMPGAVAAPRGKVVEVDLATRAVQFEATVTPPTASFGITFHRVERLPLYPQ
jgi:arylsulfate sulfotransferase